MIDTVKMNCEDGLYLFPAYIGSVLDTHFVAQPH